MLMDFLKTPRCATPNLSHRNLWTVFQSTSKLNGSFQTIGGNLATASPVSDIIPILVAGHCSLKLISSGKKNI